MITALSALATFIDSGRVTGIENQEHVKNDAWNRFKSLLPNPESSNEPGLDIEGGIQRIGVGSCFGQNTQ